jgi:hypothetical protein
VLNAIRTFGANIRDLELPEDIGDGCPNDKVEPVALMPDLHLLPGIWTANIGYGKLLDELQARLHLVAPAGGDPSRIPNLVPVAYGWRLSNRYNGQRLKTIVEPALSRWRAQGAPVCRDEGDLHLPFNGRARRPLPSSDRQRAMVGPLEPEEYRQHATIGPLKPGAYRLVVGDLDPYRSRWLRSPRRSWCEM